MAGLVPLLSGLGERLHHPSGVLPRLVLGIQGVEARFMPRNQCLLHGPRFTILDYRDKPGNDGKTKSIRDTSRRISDDIRKPSPPQTYIASSISGTGHPWACPGDPGVAWFEQCSANVVCGSLQRSATLDARNKSGHDGGA